MVKIPYLILMLFLCSSISCQNRRLPKNVSPSEVNHLVEPTRYSSQVEPGANTIDDTIKEVEAALRVNPSLPRLTRGEILELLENITKSDANLSINQHSGQQPSISKGKKPKAIMKVLPYTPDSNLQNLEDLYTKPPMTEIVGSKDNEFSKPTAEKTKKYHRNKNSFSSTPVPSSSTNTIQLYSTEPQSFEPLKTPCFGTENSKCNPPHFKEKDLLHVASQTTTSTSSSTKNVSRRRRPTVSRKKTSTTSSTTVAAKRYPNHKYEDEISAESNIDSGSTLFPSHSIKIVPPPSLPPKVINEDLLPLHTQDSEVYHEEKVPVPVKVIDLTQEDNGSKEKSKLHLVVDIPQHLKGVLGELNGEMAFKNVPKKIKSPHKSSSKPTNSVFDKLEDKDVATTTPMPDIDDVVDTLTPEMKKLIMSFGLLPDPDSSPKPSSDSQIYYENYNPENAEISPSSYAGFKPLPDDDNGRDEMQELLARFGLGRKARKQKAINAKSKNEKQLTNEYQKNEHLNSEKGENLKAEFSSKQQHVFNPSDNLYATKEEIEKLNKLSKIVKHLESLNRPLTNEDLKNLDVDTLRTLVKSLNNTFVPLDEQNAPDPLTLGYELIKNDIKRQEDKTNITENITNHTSTESSTTSTTASEVTKGAADSSTKETTEASKEPSVSSNIKDLEDSFGGQSEPTTTTAPPSKQTGFYYLFDWNSFFDIDDQKGKRVNLRFQPKSGDPKRFYSVTVP